MRKILLSTIALMMTISMMAVGLGNGKDKANAIDFDWVNGHKPALSSGSWYCVDLTPLKAEANDPTLALYLTNLTDETSSVSLTLQATVLGQSVNQKSSYNIAANDYQLWSKQSFEYGGRVLSLKQLMAAGLSEVYLQLTANKEIALSAKVYETEDIVDDACSTAKDFNWAGVSVFAGEQWYRLNLADVKNSGNELKLVVANNGGAAANVAFDMSLDCPASAVIEKDWVIAAGAEKKEDFGRVFLDFLNEDYIFVKLTTNQPLTFSVEEEVVDPSLPNPYADFNCVTAAELAFDEEINLTAGKHVYKVKREELIAERDFDTEFHVTNNTGFAANLAVEVAFACPVKSVVTQNLEIDAHESIMKLVKGDMLKAVNSEWVYIRFITDQDLTATIGMRNVSPCANATPFDWTTGADLAAGTSEWFVVDIAALKQNKQHLTLGITNYSEATALVNMEVALDCNGTILPMTLPVIGGMNVSQTIDYQLLARAPLNRIYVGVSTDSHIKIVSSVKDAIATDKTPCLNAINPEHGVEYTQKANTTQWYKLSLDWLESTTDYSSIYLASKGSSRAHVTIGVVTDCQYTTSTKVSIPLPAGVSFGMLAPNVLGKLLKELTRFESAYNKVDSRDLYVEVYTDQPIGFGLDVVNAATSPCLREDLVTFDWNKGAKIQAGTPVWYDVDLTTIKNTGKHVKLTFTNHTDSLVWAATVVSVDCPAKLTMPLVLPVPARMSIDKFIDYHYFAVPNVDNIYVGVVADGALEMAATTYDAVIAPSADCLNAVEVTSDFSYTQKAGSQWYKFPMGLLNDGGHAGKVSFRNLGAQTATLTAGMTVGCEYAIPTYGKVKMPKELAFSLAVPTSILAKARKFIDADITEFYMQLTSDQDIVVALDMDASDLKACSSAIPFDWNNWEKNGLQLQANQDIWYEVNLRYPWEKMKKGEDLVLAVTNNNNVPVEFEAAVSPTCPVFFALESYATIPSNVTAQQIIEFSKLAEFLKQFDRELYNDETALIIEKYNAYVVLNKIDAQLGKYGKYFPVSHFEAILEQYGHYIACAELKNLIDNREKYLSKAEIKTRLNEAKERLKEEAQERLSFEQAIQAVDKLDAYVPYVDAEMILENYDLLLPYVGGAKALLDKCKTYIPTDQIKQVVVKAKNAIPVDKIKVLFDKIEARLPRDLNCYMRIKTTGEIIVEPDTILPAPDGCEDAIEYVWGTDVVVNEEAWYKVSIADVRNKDCSITLTVTNNSADSVKADLSLYENCDDEQAFLTMKNVGIAPNTTRSKTFSASELPGDIDVLYLYAQPNGEITINLSTDCPVFQYVYDTIATYACGTEVLTWNDTVHVSKYLDSVYTYVITPLVTPIIITQAILDTISGATPVSTPGTTPDMTASADAIKAYYLAQDTEALADVVKVEWTVTPIACGATTHTMTLTIEDECGNQQTADFTLDVTTPTLDVTNNNVTICASELPYTLNGITYPSEGTFTTIIPNIYGCDSAQVNMTINLYPAIPETKVVEVICANALPYVWNGKTYNDSAKDTVVLVSNINGCDSVVTLDLTVLPAIETYDTVTVCYGQTYYWAEASMNCKREGPYQATLTSAHGCDSVVNLTVKWLPKVVKETATVETICDAQVPYIWRNSSYNVTGTYYDTVQNYLGCDSIIFTLDLTVEPKTITPQTITDYVCDGTEYVDPITGDKHIISSLIPSTQTWTNTVPVSVCEDIVYTYQITPIVAPEKMNDSILATITSAIPVLKQGELPVVDASVIAIKAYYQGLDTETISDVVTVMWKYNAGIIPCDATTYTMTLMVEDECDNVLETTFLFNVEARTVTETTTNATICYGVMYRWDVTGKDYSVAGEYRDTLRTANGCDQEIRILTLVVNKPSVGDTTAVICESELPYTWYGNVLNAAGTAQTTLTNAVGCDSIVTLTLVVNKPSVGDTTAVICESELPYTWYGNVLNAAGTAQTTLTNAAGCDSIVTLTLVVNKPSVGDTTAVICESELPYTWYGNVLNAAGTAQTTLTNAVGCDSIVTLTLVVNKPSVGDTTAVICESELPYTWYGNVLNAAGTAQTTLTNAVGCDSIVTLTLVVNKPSVGDTTAVICESELPYTWYGNVLNAAGTAQTTLTNAVGCDSIVTLTLVVNKPSVGDTTAVICESELPYTWYGNVLNAAGTAQTTLTNAVGCDSIVTLTLVVNKPSVGDTTAVICESELPYTWYGNVLNAAGTAQTTLTNAVGCDSIVTLTLVVNKPSVGDTTAVICESELPYTWYGNVLNAAGTAQTTLTNAAGCDSIVTLTLVVNKPSVGDTTAVICESELPYTWYGNVLNAAGTAQTTLTNAVGCDSIVTLTLVVNKPSVGDTTAVICESELPYTWYGNVLNAAGAAQTTLTNAAGCDSIVTLTLVVNKPSVGDTTAVICESELPYTWYGNVLNAAGTAQTTLTNAVGCDSIVTLTLVVNKPSVGDTTVVICESELPYTWYGNVLNAAGTAQTTLTNAAGCDSIVTLTLVVNQATVGTPEYVTLCNGETYTWNGSTYKATGEYNVTLTNAVGCDSTAILNLTVLPEATVETEEWTLCPGDLSTPRDWHGQSISAAGNYEAIEKFAGTDCDSVIYHLTVIIPDADNNATMDNLPAVSKYNNRIIMLNLNEIKDMFDGWAPAEADVQWFRVVGTQDAAYAAWNKLGDDEPLDKGHYYNLLDGGTLPAGQYYALLWRSSDVCEGGEIMRTVLITCGVDASGPRLVPNVVRANEILTLENLNPSEVNEVRVYSSTGQLVATYTAEQVSKFIFNAATVSGYYLVDVENKNNKVTLRYVVK